MRFEDADKLEEGTGKSSFGQWIVITVAALFVSVGLVFLVSMVGFMLYDFVVLMLPVLVIIGAFAALIYWIYRMTRHHNLPKAHNP
jgi:hypothetical protein